MRSKPRETGAEHVNGHDCPDPSVPRAYPYGIYDQGRNTGFANIGTHQEMAAIKIIANALSW
jgi:Rhodopirellula transposase DDE domain